jgi:predicted MFS family arabinose efflux permease
VLLAQATAATPYAEWVLPALILQGAGIGSAAVVAIVIGQQGVAPRDAGTAGAMNQVSQQVGSAIGIALISTFVATATANYLRGHAARPRRSAPPCTASPPGTGGRPAFTSAVPSSWAP